MKTLVGMGQKKVGAVGEGTRYWAKLLVRGTSRVSKLPGSRVQAKAPLNTKKSYLGWPTAASLIACICAREFWNCARRPLGIFVSGRHGALVFSCRSRFPVLVFVFERSRRVTLYTQYFEVLMRTYQHVNGNILISILHGSVQALVVTLR